MNNAQPGDAGLSVVDSSAIGSATADSSTVDPVAAGSTAIDFAPKIASDHAGIPALVVASWASLRTEPRAQAELADECHLGTRISIMAEHGDWRLIRTSYGYEGWVRACEISTEPDLVSTWHGTFRLVKAAHTDLQPTPGIRGAALLTAVRGGLLLATGTISDRWEQVRAPGGQLGWVRAAHLGELPSPHPVLTEDLRAAITTSARRYLGVQYRWGGSGPDGIDCSGLAFMAYALNGLTIFRDAELRPPMHAISLAEIRPADLIFFPGHVAISLGSGRVIHSTTRFDGVVIGSIDPADPTYDPELGEHITGIGSLACPTTEAPEHTKKGLA